MSGRDSGWAIIGDNGITRAIFHSFDWMGEIMRHSRYVNAVAYSLRSQYLAAGGRSEVIKIWDSVTGQLITGIQVYGEIVSLSPSPDGRYIAYASLINSGMVWDLGAAKEIRRFVTDDVVLSVTFSPDGTHVATATHRSDIFIWDLQSEQLVHKLPYKDGGSLMTMSFSSDSQYLLTGHQWGKVFMWDVTTGALVRDFFRRISIVGQVSFSPDNKNISTCDGQVYLWDINTGEPVKKLDRLGDNVHLASFSLDGNYVFADDSKDDHSFAVWKSDSLEELNRFVGHQSGPVAAVFSPDSQRIFSCACDGTARLWDIKTGIELLRLRL